MSKRLNYIVFAPGYDPDSGGSIFLHQLVHALNQSGEKAFLWHWQTPLTIQRQRLYTILKRPSLLWKPQPFERDAMLNTPIARPQDLTKRSIVVYPEVTLGNPLRAKNVARWLLYRPGIRNPYDFGPDEMFFRAGEMSDLPEVTGGAPELFVWRINPIYRNENRSDRKGSCFIVRKGEAKPRIAETANAIQIDGMSHAEIAEVFNRCETFYSYDEATLYSQFAAICGCDSVVVPGFYASREDWVQSHELARYGVAYGLDDLAHARATRHLTLGVLQAQEAKGMQSVQNFVRLTQSRFG
ncbi:hypothetical protein [Cypionkella psychrotolerans]|uniref:hypothetical protein n=1 Tax=Cypionkella psychrotolerans TaxID=1678131 RepID=UPI0006B4ECD8|nr:hypothetical protein [Cypionkella psychrotolerans]